MKSYTEIEKIIKNVGDKYTVYDLKKANKEIRNMIGNQYEEAKKIENALETIMRYYFIIKDDETGEFERTYIEYDYWNNRLVS